MAAADWFPFHLGCQLTHQLFHSQPLMFLLWLRQLPRCGDKTPPLFPHPPRAGPVLLTLLFSPPSSFILLSFAWFYIFFPNWSGTPVCSQLVFCMHFCVWRCIPDVSMERDATYVHILFHPLVLQRHRLVFQRRLKWPKQVPCFLHHKSTVGQGHQGGGKRWGLSLELCWRKVQSFL